MHAVSGTGLGVKPPASRGAFSATKLWTTNVLAASAATLATLSGASSAFADSPPPIVTTYTPDALRPNPLFDALPLSIHTPPSVVPPDVVQQAFRRGVDMAPFHFRTQGTAEEHNIFAPLQHPGRLMDRVVEALNAVGIEVERPESGTYDWAKPAVAAALLLLLSLIIMKDYSKRPLIGGRTSLGDSLAGAGILLGLLCALHSLPYALSGEPRFNYAAATANYLVMGMWAFLGAWSLVASLSFRLPGPAFRVFMRRRTHHEPFMLTGPGFKKFVEATATEVKKLIQADKGTFAFQVEASHFERPEVRAALHKLGDTRVTVTIPSLSREELLTLRPMLDWMNSVGRRCTVTTTGVRNLKKATIGPNAGATGVQTTLTAGSQLPNDGLGRLLVERGLAYWHGRDDGTQGRVAITKKDIPFTDLPMIGEVLRGAIKEERTLPWPVKTLPKNGSYTITFQGTAGQLGDLSERIARRPILKDHSVKGILFRPVNAIPAGARRRMHRHIWPTTLNVTCSDLQDTDDTCEAVRVIAGPRRYAVHPKAPLVPISRAVIESIAREQQRVGSQDPAPLTLAMNKKDWNRFGPALQHALGIPAQATPAADNKRVVTFTLESATVLTELARTTDVLFATLARRKKIRVVVPLPLLAPKDVAALSAPENIAIRVPAGDLMSLEDLLYPKDRLPLRQRFNRGVATVGRSIALGVAHGRMPAIGALTTAGVPIAAPVTITTKALVGYTDPATWITSGARLFISGGINTVFLPATRSWFGPHRLNNYLLFLPGLFILALVYETANDVAHDEPERMWFKMLTEDFSYERRLEQRSRELADIHEQEARVRDRAFALKLRLGNLVVTGYHTAEDLALLRSMYDEIDDQDEHARFLAGIMNDPGFAYLVRQDPGASRFFAAAIGKHRHGIDTVLRERPEIDAGHVFAQWNQGSSKKAGGASATSSTPRQHSSHALHTNRTAHALKADGRNYANSTFNRGGQSAKWR